MAVKICSAVIPAFPARRTAMWIPPLTIVWAPMYRVMPLAAASTLPCASPKGRMAFAPVQRTITRHTDDPEQMTVDLQLGGAPLAGSGRRHADGGERGDDARRGIWKYRTSHRRRGKAATPRAVGDSTSGHSRPARERQHQRGKAVSGNAERHSAPDSIAVPHPLRPASRIVGRLPPDSDSVAVKRNPWRNRGNIVGGRLSALVENVPRDAREHDPDSGRRGVWILEHDDPAVAVRGHARHRG